MKLLFLLSRAGEFGAPCRENQEKGKKMSISKMGEWSLQMRTRGSVLFTNSGRKKGGCPHGEKMGKLLGDVGRRFWPGTNGCNKLTILRGDFGEGS